MIDEVRLGRLPASGVRDRLFMEWLLTNKSGEHTTLHDYFDLMQKRVVECEKNASPMLK
jgi:hypothetical protein